MGQAACVESDLRVALGDTIEERPCASCGRLIRSGRGEVVEGEEVAARYWFDLHSRGRDRAVRLLVKLDRASFVVVGHTDGGGIGFGVHGPRQSPLIAPREVTGRPLSRRRALRHRQLPALWRAVDTLVVKDPAIADHWDPAPG